MQANKAVQIKKTTDLNRLKRLALASQGLIGRSPFGSGTRGAIEAIEHLTYIQLDSISVIERAHNHIGAVGARLQRQQQTTGRRSSL